MIIQMDVAFESDNDFVCSFTQDEAFECSIGEAFMPEEYHGITNVTPANQTQTLETQGKVVKENIVIDPIPSNYGLVTYNGSTITVS